MADIVEGITAKAVFAPAPTQAELRQPVPQVTQESQRCGVCEGRRQIPRDHWFLELRAHKRAGAVASRATVIALRDQLWEQHRGRCPFCGGYGQVRVVKDLRGRTVGVFQYDDHGWSETDLRYLTKMNASA